MTDDWKRPKDCCNLCKYASDCNIGMPCGKWFPECHKELCGRCSHFVPFSTDPEWIVNICY
jgi:hypothetical protein